MTTPSNAVLDAFIEAEEGHGVIASTYSGSTPIMNRLTAARSRTISLFDEVAAYHSMSRQDLIDACNTRASETSSGPIDC